MIRHKYRLGLSQLSQSFGQGSPSFGGGGGGGGGMGGGYSAGYGHAPSHQWHQDKDTSDHLDHISKGNKGFHERVSGLYRI